MKIIADERIPFIKDYFSDIGELILKPGRNITPADVNTADILLVRSITQVNAALLKYSTVKFVGSVTAGADHLDTAWLDNANIAWSTAKGFNAPPVAEYVVSCIAACHLNKNLLPGKNKKAAVIGIGHVGSRVAHLLQQLGFEVICCDPPLAEKYLTHAFAPLEVLTDLDVITLHVPLTHQGSWPTHHMIDADFLRRQKSGCLLINTSRGGVINSKDLYQDGKHLQWCLDVWEHEPQIDQNILKDCFIATPHIAGYSLQSKQRGVEMIYQACVKQMNLPMRQFDKPPIHLFNLQGSCASWADAVLSTFNPLILTQQMRTLLMGQECGEAFDRMRHDFMPRHEFNTIYLNQVENLPVEHLALLQSLGFRRGD